jgi:hypothetical protein
MILVLRGGSSSPGMPGAVAGGATAWAGRDAGARSASAAARRRCRARACRSAARRRLRAVVASLPSTAAARFAALAPARSALPTADFEKPVSAAIARTLRPAPRSSNTRKRSTADKLAGLCCPLAGVGCASWSLIRQKSIPRDSRDSAAACPGLPRDRDRWDNRSPESHTSRRDRSRLARDTSVSPAKHRYLERLFHHQEAAKRGRPDHRQTTSQSGITSAKRCQDAQKAQPQAESARPMRAATFHGEGVEPGLIGVAGLPGRIPCGRERRPASRRHRLQRCVQGRGGCRQQPRL